MLLHGHLLKSFCRAKLFVSAKKIPGRQPWRRECVQPICTGLVNRSPTPWAAVVVVVFVFCRA